MTEVVSKIGIESSRGIPKESDDGDDVEYLRCFEEDDITTDKFTGSSFQTNSTFDDISSEEDTSQNESTGSHRKRKM
jgi:hypothetical protein